MISLLHHSIVFVVFLVQLQQLASRPTAAFIDSRQLKICATCFDISVGLLRVLEMVANLTPELLTDWSKPSAELLLCRLFQVGIHLVLSTKLISSLQY